MLSNYNICKYKGVSDVASYLVYFKLINLLGRRYLDTVIEADDVNCHRVSMLGTYLSEQKKYLEDKQRKSLS